MIQMNVHQISAVVGGNMVGKEARVKGVTTDSRIDCKGKLFVALSGEFFNGEAFCQMAIEKGAVAVLVSHAVEVDVPQIIVKDTLVALQAIATAWIKQTGVKVIGITGSNGKTTVKNMLYSVLSQKYQCYATPGNFNNEIGVPLSLLAVSSNDEVAVIEMGAAQVGDVKKLTDIIKPDIAVITNIGDAHVGRFGSVDNIAVGKAEIYEALDVNGKGLVNVDSQYAVDFKQKIKGSVITFGQSQEADFRLVESSQGYQVVTRRGEKFALNLSVMGVHNYMNATAALAIGVTMQLTIDEIQKGLSDFEPEDGRLQVYETSNGIKIIDDSYNANPTSVKAAIDVLIKQNKPQVLVIGDMLELGDLAAQMHQEIGEYSANKKLDVVVAVGKFATNIQQGFSKENMNNFIYSNVEDLIQGIHSWLPDKGTVLIKGSRSMRLEKVVQNIMGSAR